MRPGRRWTHPGRTNGDWARSAILRLRDRPNRRVLLVGKPGRRWSRPGGGRSPAGPERDGSRYPCRQLAAGLIGRRASEDEREDTALARGALSCPYIAGEPVHHPAAHDDKHRSEDVRGTSPRAATSGVPASAPVVLLAGGVGGAKLAHGLQ